MFVYTSIALELGTKYAEFVHQLSQARFYFGPQNRKEPNDARILMNALKASYFQLNVPNILANEFLAIILNTDRILAKSHIPEQEYRHIHDLLWNFIRREASFRDTYFRTKLARAEIRLIPEHLYNEVGPLLFSENFDSSVLTAFKYLDMRLQQALKVAPAQTYGESLINYAFSPTSGRLQLETNPNEQLGLRNFFSGANALFRNPSAHRFVKYDRESALVIVAMVGVMCEIVKQLLAQARRRSAKDRRKNRTPK